MVRERVAPGSGAAATAELSRLRQSYTQVADDAAQLAVSLKLTRGELEEAKAEIEALRQKNAQLQKDAQADEVGRTLAELERVYEENTRELRERFIEAETQRGILAETVEKLHETVTELQEAFTQASANHTELDLREKRNRDRLKELSKAPLAGLESLRAAGKALKDENAEMESKVGELELVSGNLTVEQSRSLELFQKQIQDLFQGFQEVLWPDSTPSVIGPREGSSLVAKDKGDAALQEPCLSSWCAEDKNELLLRVLQSALQFVASHLESGDTQCARLLDASLSDAELVNELRSKLHHLTRDRDRLLQKLTKSLNLIEQNRLTVLENAMLHEVPLEDSLSAAEAAEQIALLRDQLDVAAQLHKWGMKEIEDLKKTKEDLEGEVRRLRKGGEITAQQLQRTDDALQQSLAREKELLKRSISLQSQVAALAAYAPVGSPSNETGEGEGEGASLDADAPPRPPPLSELLQRVSVQLAGIERAAVELNARRRGQGVPPEASLCPSPEHLAERIARGGFGQVVELLHAAMVRAKGLQEGLEDGMLRHAAGLAALLRPGVSSSEGALLAERERRAALEAELNVLKAEKEQVRQRLQAAEDGMAKAEEAKHRILSISKTLMERQSRLLEENKQLKSRLGSPDVGGGRTAPEETQAAVALVEGGSPPAQDDPPPAEHSVESEAAARGEETGIPNSDSTEVNEKPPPSPPADAEVNLECHPATDDGDNIDNSEI
ncbi:unnamed protein product [Phytomonas sp. EM1]|nr:unnamed protein product [Phytomonas sp. EM1]|eukprot:CCW63454.1 unnamed protein product [Phytomonas sp. isolate EM1]